MELLQYKNSDIDNTNGRWARTSPVTWNTGQHISIQRINCFFKTGVERHYRILWLSSGIESVGIDEENFFPFPNQIIFIHPGKKLIIKTSGNPVGWILHLSKDYLNTLRHENFLIAEFDLLSLSEELPKIALSPKIGERIQMLAGMIDELAGSQFPNKESGINALLKAILVYCNSNCNVNFHIKGNTQEISIASRFKKLVSENFTQCHMVSDYAKMMNITPKYINQVVKQIMRVTAKQVIQEQLIMKARRDLKFSNRSVKEIAFSLGFIDPFHFSNFFKEQVGFAPTRYREMIRPA